MNINNLQQANNERISAVTSSGLSTIEICRILKLNTDYISADIEIIDASRVLNNVPICLPGRFVDVGMFHLPEVGSLAIVATTTNSRSFIIGFTAYTSLSSVEEILKSGEFLIQSEGKSYVKVDVVGNMILGSPSPNLYLVGQNGSVERYSYAETFKNTAQEIESGIINNEVAIIEKIYDSKMDSELSAEDIVDKVLRDEVVNIEKPSPIITIEKGNVFDENGIKEKLIILGDPELDSEISVRIQIGHNETALNIVTDKSGNLKLKGNKLILEFDEIQGLA